MNRKQIEINILLLSGLFVSVAALAANTEIVQGTDSVGNPVQVEVPRFSVQKDELTVLVNDSDPQSVAVAAYYKTAHNLPEGSFIHLNFTGGVNDMSISSFNTMRATVLASRPPKTQGFAVTWTQPFRVGCMSITSALALGYDPKWCWGYSGGTCKSTATISYPLSTTKPVTDLNIYPSMMIGAYNVDLNTAINEAYQVIDRGAIAQQTLPLGDGYFLRTSDSVRSVRYPDFQSTVTAWNRPDGLIMYYLQQDSISNKTNILYYLTGLAVVPNIATNTFIPGAVADHLTSYGGVLDGSAGQMQSLEWLRRGATASYGTVVEPCGYPYKFPKASRLVPAYFQGNTILEAYWKSVDMPGEGIFVGDPLSRPFGTQVSVTSSGNVSLKTSILQVGTSYDLQGYSSTTGASARLSQNISVTVLGYKQISVNAQGFRKFRLVLAGSPLPVVLLPPSVPQLLQ